MARAELRGKNALVTAGASGIGRAIADLFVEAGANVWVCDVDEDALASAGAELVTSRTDVADESAVAALMAEVGERWGRLDILVNNAGIAGPTAPVEEIDPADWRRTIDVDLNGTFYCTRLAVPLLRESQGSIVNISSVAGRLGYPLRTPYAAAKWAIVGLTESLAKELGPSGVRVNAILPGPVAGPRIQAVFEARAEASGETAAEVEAQYVRSSSLRRLVQADDIAEMALFLCTRAGANITGQALSVCAGVETI